jgi:hypothetical protein
MSALMLMLSGWFQLTSGLGMTTSGRGTSALTVTAGFSSVPN